MKGERTNLEFEKHELFTTQQEGILVHHLKKPDTNCDNVKFINTNGIMAVTGDYGNWIFCREFHPVANAKVSDQYWIEKLEYSSTQKPMEFDKDATEAEIENMLADEDEDLNEEEIEYLTGCIENIDDNFDYEYHAHRNNVGRFSDHENVPLVEKPTHWLLVVFDAYEEICRRLEPIKTTA